MGGAPVAHDSYAKTEDLDRCVWFFVCDSFYSILIEPVEALNFGRFPREPPPIGFVSVAAFLDAPLCFVSSWVFVDLFNAHAC